MIAFSNITPPAVKFYNTCVRENPLYQRLPSLLPPAAFAAQYAAMRPFFARQYPWNLIREGQTVIQVSSAKMLVRMGLSQALIMAAVVGRRGRVVVVEPDPVNVAFLRAYLQRHRIGHVEVIEKGIWNERGKKSFTVVGPRTSANVMTEALPATTVRHAQRQGWTEQMTSREIEVDTIDHIVEERSLSPVSFINITINGCEYEAIQGMSQTLRQEGLTVAFPLDNPRTFHSPILSALEREGFHVLLAHSPVFLSQPQFLVACAVKRPVEELRREGWHEVRLAMEDGLVRMISADGNKGWKSSDYRSEIRWF